MARVDELVVQRELPRLEAANQVTKNLSPAELARLGAILRAPSVSFEDVRHADILLRQADPNPNVSRSDGTSPYGEMLARMGERSLAWDSLAPKTQAVIDELRDASSELAFALPIVEDDSLAGRLDRLGRKVDEALEAVTFAAAFAVIIVKDRLAGLVMGLGGK